MRKIIYLLGIALLSLFAGCGTPAPYVMRNKLDHSTMQQYLQEGNTKVTGQAFLKTRGGDVKYGAGNTVKLYPAVAYIDEYSTIPWFQSSNIQGRDSGWYNYIKTTTSDGTGNFEFDRIPPGNYYIETSVTWQVPSSSGLSTQGGTVKKRIIVPKEGVVKVVLTE